MTRVASFAQQALSLEQLGNALHAIYRFQGAFPARQVQPAQTATRQTIIWRQAQSAFAQQGTLPTSRGAVFLARRLSRGVLLAQARPHAPIVTHQLDLSQSPATVSVRTECTCLARRRVRLARCWGASTARDSLSAQAAILVSSLFSTVQSAPV